MSVFMQYSYLFLAVCAIIFVIAFPIVNAAKKRNRENMHLFDDMRENREEQKKRTSGTIMESAFVIAIVYLIVFFSEIMRELLVISHGSGYIPVITITIVVSVVVLVIRAFRRKRSHRRKGQ